MVADIRIEQVLADKREFHLLPTRHACRQQIADLALEIGIASRLGLVRADPVLLESVQEPEPGRDLFSLAALLLP